MTMNNIEKEVQEVLTKSKFGLTETDINNASDFIDHGEYGVAFELICEQLYENKAVINADLLSIIKSAACRMGLDNSSWVFLDENPQ